MNAIERVLTGELESLLDRLAATVPGGCLPAVTSREPTLRKRLDEMDAQLALLRASLVDNYGRWRRALDDVENLWALAAYRSAPEEPAEQSPSLAA
jgi:hypothetical protein